MKIAMTIAGSDPSGGAGIQGDLKTFHSLGLYGLSVITSVTVQNTQKVYSIYELNPNNIRDQIICLLEDFSINAIKIGMISKYETAKIIYKVLKKVVNIPVILDPVMISKSGYFLLNNYSKIKTFYKLIPISFVITPNLYEAEILSQHKIKNINEMKNAAIKIHNMGAKNVIIKGGHITFNKKSTIDLAYNGKYFKILESKRINTINTHGTGCTFSSSLASHIAQNNDFFKAFLKSKNYITRAIYNSLDIGKGCGPTNHFLKTHNNFF